MTNTFRNFQDASHLAALLLQAKVPFSVGYNSNYVTIDYPSDKAKIQAEAIWNLYTNGKA